MAKEVFMPKLSSTMQVGTLLQWFKEEGDTVEIGEPLFEIMTDKINIEVESYEEGNLIKRYFEEDDEVPVNHVVGYIGEMDEVVPDSPPGEAGGEESKVEETTSAHIDEDIYNEETGMTKQVAAKDGEKLRATPAARRVAKEQNFELQDVKGTGPNGRIHESDVKGHTETKVQATPLAKKVAKSENIEITTIKGSGKNGKIYRADVEGDSSHDEELSSPPKKRMKMEGIRKVVAHRMAESAFTAPHVTINSEVDMSEVISMRKQLLGNIEKKTGYRVSYTEIIIKAVAHTLKQHPIVNASIQGDEIVFHDEIHIGLAVAIENGLLVPVVKNADQKGLASLTKECKTLGKQARERKLTSDAMSGGTFTISNLGMYAVDSFTPVINQPESAILGVCRINEKPVGINGKIELRPMMGLSLSFDHRIIDGAPAAAFLTDLKSVLEQPFELLV